MLPRGPPVIIGEEVNPPRSVGPIADDMTEKCEWPELVGVDGDRAVEQIKSERPDLQVQKMPFGSFGTTDFVPSRVRIWLDQAGNVQRAPRCG